RDLPADLVRDTHILYCTYLPRNLADMNVLEWVQINSVGYSQVMQRGLAERRIRVTNARGVYETAIGEWAIAMMTMLARDLRGMIGNKKHGIGAGRAGSKNEIRGRVVGIGGYGGIGRETARLAKLMGLSVHVLARNKIGSRRDTYTVPGTGDPNGTLPDAV